MHIATYSIEAINRLFSNNDVMPTLLRGRVFGIPNAFATTRNFLLKQATGN